MLSGQRPFKGDNVTDTLAAVLRADPAWTDLPPETPPAIHRLLRRCLRKDPRGRVQHVGDVRVELVDVEEDGPEPPSMATVPRQSLRRAMSAFAVAAFLTILGIRLGRWFGDRDAAAAVIPVAFTVTLPADEELAGGFPSRPIAISRTARRRRLLPRRPPGDLPGAQTIGLCSRLTLHLASCASPDREACRSR
jgi:serine/threonine protein kinase